MTYRATFLAAATLLLAGCGDGKPPTHPVVGRVTVRGQPATGALVVFHPMGKGVENASKPFATVAEDGSFTLALFGTDDGAIEGEYGVTVVWNVKPKDAKEAKVTIGEGGPRLVDRLGGRYGNPSQPRLNATVKKGQENKFTFDLE